LGASDEIENPADISHCALIAVLGGVDSRIFEAGQVGGQTTTGAAAPGIGRGGWRVKEIEESLKAGIQQGAGQTVAAQNTGKEGNAGRRLAWLGNRGVDE
jgi:hypothetical protein